MDRTSLEPLPSMQKGVFMDGRRIFALSTPLTSSRVIWQAKSKKQGYFGFSFEKNSILP